VLLCCRFCVFFVLLISGLWLSCFFSCFASPSSSPASFVLFTHSIDVAMRPVAPASLRPGHFLITVMHTVVRYVVRSFVLPHLGSCLALFFPSILSFSASLFPFPPPKFGCLGSCHICIMRSTDIVMSCRRRRGPRNCQIRRGKTVIVSYQELLFPCNIAMDRQPLFPFPRRNPTGKSYLAVIALFAMLKRIEWSVHPLASILSCTRLFARNPLLSFSFFVLSFSFAVLQNGA
jgi:hypothetical protein